MYMYHTRQPRVYQGLVCGPAQNYVLYRGWLTIVMRSRWATCIITRNACHTGQNNNDQERPTKRVASEDWAEDRRCLEVFVRDGPNPNLSVFRLWILTFCVERAHDVGLSLGRLDSDHLSAGTLRYQTSSCRRRVCEFSTRLVQPAVLFSSHTLALQLQNEYWGQVSFKSCLGPAMGWCCFILGVVCCASVMDSLVLALFLFVQYQMTMCPFFAHRCRGISGRFCSFCVEWAHDFGLISNGNRLRPFRRLGP